MSLIKLIGSWITKEDKPKRMGNYSIFWDVSEVLIKVTSKNKSVLEFKALEEADYTRNYRNLQIMKLAEPLESIEINATCRDSHHTFVIWSGISVADLPIVSKLKKKPVDDLLRVRDVVESFIEMVEMDDMRRGYLGVNKPIKRVDNQGDTYDVRELLDRIDKTLKEETHE